MPSGPQRRDIDADELETLFFNALGCHPPTLVQGHPRVVPRGVVPDVDVEAWAAVAFALLPAFSYRLPPLQQVTKTVRGAYCAVVALRSGGSLASAAALVSASRKALREALRESGLLDAAKALKGPKKVRRRPSLSRRKVVTD